MKKLMSMILVVSIALSLSGCGEPKVIEGKEVPTYGLFNEQTKKHEDIKYEISMGNVVWSIILVETVIAPVYFIGYSLYNPIEKKVIDKCK